LFYRVIQTSGEFPSGHHALALRLTETAEADLAEIWLHIAVEASEDVASRFVAAIEAAFEPVRHFPLAAPLREHLAPGLRVTFHPPYAIYYRPLADAVVIIRVLHGARDVATIAEQGGFPGLSE
jgi:toxin ParE1/3/4